MNDGALATPLPSRSPSRSVNLTEARTLIRRHAVLLLDDDLQKPNLKWAKYRIEHMLALLHTLLPHD